MNQKILIVAVTNDLSYDQRMRRICSSLARHSFRVTLVGRLKSTSVPLQTEPYSQHRFKLPFFQGVLFYLFYNLYLATYLWTHRFDACLAVDYDTLPACYLVCKLRRKKFMIDCHEWYEEAPELLHRPLIRGLWKYLGLILLPKVTLGFSVTAYLADHFSRLSKRPFTAVRNMPMAKAIPSLKKEKKVLIYQGVLNRDRGLEDLIRAMTMLPDYKLWLCGDGDLRDELANLVKQLQLSRQIVFWGNLPADHLHEKISQAALGFNLLTGASKSYYYSLANKFFDYVQAGTPVITVNYPEYQRLMKEFKVGDLLSNVSPEKIAAAVLSMERNPDGYQQMIQECLSARQYWTWENEEKLFLKTIDAEFGPEMRP